MNKKIIFIPLAKNQVDFYLELAKTAKSEGGAVEFICCHEKSCGFLESAGFKVHNFHKTKRKMYDKVYTQEALSKLLAKFSIELPNLYISHEREAYLINDPKELCMKFYYSLLAFQSIFETYDSSESSEEIVVVQELGGFISVLSSYFIALSRGINNYFIEPSFFRARVFFVKNSLKAKFLEKGLSEINEEEFSTYIEKTLVNQSIVIPSKDKLHYRGVLTKFFNFHNLKRLVQKIIDKYIFKLEEEFQYIFVHFYKNLTAMWNKFRLISRYRNIPEGTINYFPLHVPADIALTVRSPLYFDQCYLLEQIAKSLKLGEILCIKEHPAMQGAISNSSIRKLLNRNRNIVLLKPSINNFEILRKSERVYTVNSKAGAEALLLGKEVCMFGDSFYNLAPGVEKLSNLQDLFSPRKARQDTEDESKNFFRQVWSNSYPGDLYNLEPKNIKIFFNSLKELLS